MRTSGHLKGFTLIEMSIVLVIIGLIVGGVLVGQDLIRAAQVRAQISQIEKYNTAVNTFRVKYDCLPGDCKNAQALLSPTGNGYVPNIGTIQNGNGNGQVEFAFGNFTWGNNGNDEVSNFFPQLSAAGMVDGTFAINPGTVSLVGSGYSYPASIAGTGNGLMAFSYNGANYWYVGVTPGSACFAIAGGYGHGTDNAGCLTDSTFAPRVAYAIDKKIDDGNPTSGNAQAYWGVTHEALLDPSSGVNVQNPGASLCANTSSTYNISGSYAATPLCQMMIRFQ